MKKYIIYKIVIFGILFNGYSFSQSNDLSVEENKAIDSILKVYDGEVKYSKVYELNYDKGKKFEISLTKSNALKDYQNHKHLPASNIALIFYSRLSKIDKSLYSKILISLDYDGEIKNYEYSVQKLEKVYKCLNKVSSMIGFLKNKKYSELKLNINSYDFLKYDKDKLINKMVEVDRDFGSVEGNVITGFTFHKTEEGIPFIKIYGFLKRSIKDNFYSFYIKPSNCEVVLLEYKW